MLLRLAGDIGQIQANQSVNAVRDIVANDTPPPGLKVYVSGAAPLASDTLSIANASLNNITIVTIVLIIVMLLLVYRSVSTLLVPLASVLFEMLIAKGVVSTLGHFGVIPLSSFAVNIVVALTLGAGTDYGIFLLGRYQEARQAGESREEAYYTAYRGVSPIIIGSGLTIAGAGFCLSFARLDYFHTMGPAVAIGMLLTIAAALTLGPAILTVGSLFGLFDPKRMVRAHLYRRIGASVVRWPKPILAASCAVVMLGAIFVPTYRVSYDDRAYQPANASANQGFAASDRHFSQSKLFTEMLMVESDHDMRNSADFISLDRVAKSPHTSSRRRDGAEHHQAPGPTTRPREHPLPVHHARQRQRSTAAVHPAAERRHRQAGADPGGHPWRCWERQSTSRRRCPTSCTRRFSPWRICSRSPTTINDNISNLDDFIRPLKNYFYWEPHCFDIPICWAFRSLFDGLDGIDSLDAEIANAVTDLQAVDQLLPQLITQLKIMMDDTQALQAVVVNTYGPTHLQTTQTDQTFDDMINVGNDFDASRSDDFFYMPREAFDNEDVKTGMTLMMSPDGKAARFIVTHEGNAMGPEGVEHVEAFPEAIKTALKETSLAGSRRSTSAAQGRTTRTSRPTPPPIYSSWRSPRSYSSS